jgi:serine/threonine protein kinase
MLNGGKMIAKGTYGCVYKPALLCEDSEIRGDGVSKLMQKRDAEGEIKEQERVDEIDPQFKYHLKTPTICGVGEYDVETDFNLDECELIPEERHSDVWKEDYVLMQMEDGGKSIYDTMHKREKHIFKESLEWKKKFILGMKNLFEGLRDFEEEHFVHFDIKSQNIVYKEETNRFNFIDFGLSTPRNKINDNFGFMLTAGYYALPFDIILTKYSNYRLLKDATKEHLQDAQFKRYLMRIFDRTYNGGYMPNFESMYIDGSDSGASIYKPTYENIEILEKIHHEMKTRSRENVIDEMHSKLDVFSLGVILIELFYTTSGIKYNVEGPDSRHDVFYKDLHALIKKMIDPFFKERYSASEAYEHFMELVHKYGIHGSVVPQPISSSLLKAAKTAKKSTSVRASAKTAVVKPSTKTRVKVTRKKLKLVDSFSGSKSYGRTASISRTSSSRSGTRKRHMDVKTRMRDGEVTVRNPHTGRWIKKSGRLAKKLGLA